MNLNVSLTAKATNGSIVCSTDYNDSILVYPTPDLAFSFSPGGDGEMLEYTTDGVYIALSNESVQDGVEYLWDFGDNRPAEIGATDHTYIIENIEEWYPIKDNDWKIPIKLTGSSDHCEDTLVKNVRIIPPEPYTEDSYATKGCDPLMVEFNGSNVMFADTLKWDFGTGVSPSYDWNPIYYYPAPNSYIMTLYAKGPAVDDWVSIKQDSVIVWEKPRADFKFNPDTIFLAGEDMPKPQPVRFNNLSVNATSYLWHFGDDSTSIEPSPIHVYQESGDKFVKLFAYTVHGCVDSTDVTTNAVTVLKTGRIEFPTAFTPNTDGEPDSRIIPYGYSGNTTEFDLNDLFYPVYRYVDPVKYELQIFNRWGILIFQTNDISEGWTGYYNGKILPQDVYVWQIKGRFLNGQVINKKGSITLLR